MNTALVSVIIPIYNVEEYLYQCVESIQKQTYTHLEIFVIDDGSVDRSLNILKEFSLKDSRIKIIEQENLGVSSARNVGLSRAQGEYILFVDADDWLDTDTISQCMQQIQKQHADVCLFAYMREFSNHSAPRNLFPSDRIFNQDECRDLQRRMIGPIGPELRKPGMLDSLGTIWGKLYRREILENLEFVDLKIIGTAEDTLYNTFAFLKVKKAVYINQPFYHYRKFNNGSETKRYKPELYLQWNRLFEKMTQAAVGDSGLEALNNRIALSAIGLGLNESISKKTLGEQKSKLKMILCQPHYKEAYGRLIMTYFPIHWKAFFFVVKYRYCYFYIFLIKCIKSMMKLF